MHRARSSDFLHQRYCQLTFFGSRASFFPIFVLVAREADCEPPAVPLQTGTRSDCAFSWLKWDWKQMCGGDQNYVNGRPQTSRTAARTTQISGLLPSFTIQLVSVDVWLRSAATSLRFLYILSPLAKRMWNSHRFVGNSLYLYRLSTAQLLAIYPICGPERLDVVCLVVGFNSQTIHHVIPRLTAQWLAACYHKDPFQLPHIFVLYSELF